MPLRNPYPPTPPSSHCPTRGTVTDARHTNKIHHFIFFIPRIIRRLHSHQGVTTLTGNVVLYAPDVSVSGIPIPSLIQPGTITLTWYTPTIPGTSPANCTPREAVPSDTVGTALAT